jgi:DNA/RNA-binding domain of Phe-tRNA-synthetase-like protein
MSGGTEIQIQGDDHPLLRWGGFVTTFPAPLGETPSPPWLVELLRIGAPAPLLRQEDVRAAVRDMLRWGGYKPTGRGKPASEYLVRAAEEGALASINAAVDALNAASLHSGLPISAVDADLASPPYRIAVAPAGARYVFNASGQEIDLEGLVSLFDALGPCGNAVKDAQRTKTHSGTHRTLSIVWGAAGHEERLQCTVAWYRELLERLGASTRSL